MIVLSVGDPHRSDQLREDIFMRYKRLEACAAQSRHFVQGIMPKSLEKISTSCNINTVNSVFDVAMYAVDIESHT